MTGTTGNIIGPISVIIAARNAAATVPATLRSLLPDRELIGEVLVVDDGSTDATAVTAERLAREYTLPLSMIAAAVGNAGAARNIGLDRAAGSFIYFLDADDEVIPNGLRTLLSALQAAPEAGLALGTSIRRTAGRPDKPKVPLGYGADRQANARAYLANRLWPIAIGSALVRREAAVSARFPVDLRYDEDTCYWAALLQNHAVVACSEPVLDYHLDEQRAAGRLTTSPRRSFLRAAAALTALRSAGIDKATLQRRKAWIALRIARQHLKLREWALAGQFLDVAKRHPDYARSWIAFRYSVSIAAGRLFARR